MRKDDCFKFFLKAAVRYLELIADFLDLVLRDVRNGFDGVAGNVVR